MSDNCTIYCKDRSVDYVGELVRERFGASSIRTDHSNNSVIVDTEFGSLTLTTLVFRERRDRFSRLRFSTYMFFDRLSTDSPDVKERILSHIQSCEMIIGAVAIPDFEAHPDFTPAVFAIAIDLDGLVFTGQEMMDATGATLMASGG